ncbi:secreted protein [Longimycelium tulufanense]|uniref:Secreted protein n=1 Tax=Longimycelium tulufanense TaxID=907463 RepID=A0A8J3CA92_9PSEU|nr:hypothetical protein [Longimycelium tulufanense]GGM38076.1 secreted protein [Longimycelium tulufanense]
MPLRVRRLMIASALSITALTAGATAVAVAAAGSPSAKEDDQPPAVEDYGYPGAAAILKEKGITLHKGDGHILLTKCDDVDKQITVLTRHNKEGQYCFRVTGSTGYLTLEIPETFAIQAEEHPVRATLTANGKTETLDVDRHRLEGVGEGLVSSPTILIELRVGS